MLKNLIETKGLNADKVLSDKVCVTCLKLAVMVYALWGAFIIFCYPWQFITAKSTISFISIAALVISFAMLGIMTLFIDRIYLARIYRMKINESRNRYNKEMKFIEENWERLDNGLPIKDFQIDAETEVG